MSEIETPLPRINKERDFALWMPVQLASQPLITEEDSEEDPVNMGVEPELYDICMPSYASTNFLWTCKLAYTAERVADVVCVAAYIHLVFELIFLNIDTISVLIYLLAELRILSLI